MDGIKLVLKDSQTLFPISGNFSGFTCKIVSEKKEPFYALILNQAELDSEQKKEFQRADGGVLEATITKVSDADNWYLALKTVKKGEENPVTIYLNTNPSESFEAGDQPQVKKKLDWILVLIVLLVVGLGAFVLVKFATNKGGTKIEETTEPAVSEENNYMEKLESLPTL